MRKLMYILVAAATLGMFTFAQAAMFHNHTNWVCYKGKCHKNNLFGQQVTVLGKGGKFDVMPNKTVKVNGLVVPKKYYSKVRPYKYLVRIDADSKPTVYYKGKRIHIQPMNTFYISDNCTYTVVTKIFKGQYAVGLLKGKCH